MWNLTGVSLSWLHAGKRVGTAHGGVSAKLLSPEGFAHIPGNPLGFISAICISLAKGNDKKDLLPAKSV